MVDEVNLSVAEMGGSKVSLNCNGIDVMDKGVVVGRATAVVVAGDSK